jgi:mannitol-1-/sugar-/sorbitol-6-phosphatase
VLVVTATHHRPVSAGHAAIPDYRGLSVEAAADGIRVIARA